MLDGEIHSVAAFAFPRKVTAADLNRRPSMHFDKPPGEGIQEKTNGEVISELLTEEEKVQMQLNATLNDPSYLGFTPGNFDSTMLPIPLFTSIFVLLCSLYSTFYMIYVGLNGFQAADENGLPRIF